MSSLRVKCGGCTLVGKVPVMQVELPLLAMDGIKVAEAIAKRYAPCPADQE